MYLYAIGYRTRVQKISVPPLLLCFLWSWYQDHSCIVKCKSEPFRSLIVLDKDVPHTFTLLNIGHHYVGSLCYANDIALLVPALRALLRECELLVTFCSKMSLTIGTW